MTGFYFRVALFGYMNDLFRQENCQNDFHSLILSHAYQSYQILPNLNKVTNLIFSLLNNNLPINLSINQLFLQRNNLPIKLIRTVYRQKVIC